jgi:hypothetical protein
MMEKALEYYRQNAEEDYMKVPISVLRYISELEKTFEDKKEKIYTEEDMRKAIEYGESIYQAHLYEETIPTKAEFIQSLK